MLVASAARYGLALECIMGDFAQTTQEALDPGSRINLAKPDVVLLALDHRGLPLRFLFGDWEAEQADIGNALTQLNSIRENIRANAGATCIVQTIATPPETLFGSLDQVMPGTQRRMIGKLNQAIGDSVAGTADLLLDVASLAETVGLETWHSPALWNLAKLPCDVSCMPIYAEHVARLLAAMRGKSRKCLILDLDNTVWGGVIGDDGLQGTAISQWRRDGERRILPYRNWPSSCCGNAELFWPYLPRILMR